MKRSIDRILTTHVGSLPRPNDLVELYRDDAPESKLLPRLRSAIADVVRRQSDCGIDVVNDGEFGKAMRQVGRFWRMVVLCLRPAGGLRAQSGGSEEGARRMDIRQQGTQRFCRVLRGGSERRSKRLQQCSGAPQGATSSARMYGLTCTGPVKYTGQAIVQHDIENLKSALAGGSVEEAFVTAVSPATLQILANEYYKSPEDYTWALAEAIREEYKAIVDAGFILQIDDPALVDIWDWWFSLNGDMAGYRKWAAFQVEAVNHALRGIPEDRVRFHICWGSWHGPHSGDVPLKDVVDLLLKVNAQAYSVEAGNVRHEHEWKVWKRDEAARRQASDSGRRQSRHQPDRASRTCRRSNYPPCESLSAAKTSSPARIAASADASTIRSPGQSFVALSEGAKLASKELWQ